MKNKYKTKTLASSEFVGVMQEICKLSMIEKTEKTSKYDYDLSIPFLQSMDLDKHVVFVSRNWRDLPLNSERHIYDIRNIVVKHLRIEFDDRAGFNAFSDWEPCSQAKWHFEDCQFVSPSPNMWPFSFPWEGSFRFYRNKFYFEEVHSSSCWLFGFRSRSGILYQRNDFGNCSIQITQSSHEDDSDTCKSAPSANSERRSSGSISFVGNYNIDRLNLYGKIAYCSFTGMNRVNSLSFGDLSTGIRNPTGSVYLGPREKIDPNFHHCLQHRQLFLFLRTVAANNQDTRLLGVLDKQLERIEYFLNKAQDVPFFADWRISVEYWQDRALYGWRRLSSDFYRSWLRPLVMVAVGYLVLNGMPVFFIENFSMYHWLEFTLRPVSDIPNYSGRLREMFGDCYDTVSPTGKQVINLVGIVEMIWIAMWGFAFARAIRR